MTLAAASWQHPQQVALATGQGQSCTLDQMLDKFLEFNLSLYQEIIDVLGGPDAKWQKVLNMLQQNPHYQTPQNLLQDWQVACEGCSIADFSVRADRFLSCFCMHSRSTIRAFLHALALTNEEALCRRICSEANDMAYFATLQFPRLANLPAVPNVALAAKELIRLNEEISAASSVAQQLKGQIQELKKPKQAAASSLQDDDKACVVCMDKPKTHLMAPCGHIQACHACALQILQANKPACPTCRQSVRTIYEVKKR